MSLIYTPTATATVAANTNNIAITGIDLAAVLPGMVITLGSRGKITGDGYIIQGVTPSGSSGGTVTTVEPVASAFTNAAWIVDTRDFNGTAPNYMINQFQLVQNSLLRLTGPQTNLYSGSRTLALDKETAVAVSRLLYAIGGRTWLGAEQRTLSYTPTGGALNSVETFALRAYPDGTTPTDAILVDLTTGGCDVQVAASTLVAATTVDLGSAPAGKVLITGSANIASFGAAKHKVRRGHFQNDGAVLVKSANLILPGGANITVKADDTFEATSNEASPPVWRVRYYTRADGTPLIANSVRFDVAQSLTGVQQALHRANAGINSAGALSSRNRIINGNFGVNQRAVAGAATSYGAGVYTRDRWKAGSGGVTVAFTDAGVGGIDTFATISAGSLVQVIEGSLYVVEGGSYTLSWGGSAQARINGGPYAASPITISGLTAGVNVTIEFGVGSVNSVQFEPGTVATPFERRDDELDRCQRYSEAFGHGLSGAFQDSTTFVLGASWLVSKRVSPTISFRSGSLTFLDVQGQAQFSTSSPSATFFNGGVDGGRLNISGFSGATVGRYGILDQPGVPPIFASAEL